MPAVNIQLSPHFSLAEMVASQTAARLGLDNTPGPNELSNLKQLCVNVLEPIRALLGRPIFVSSGYRSPEVNKAAGGVASSEHKLGRAADIQCWAYGTPLAICEAIAATDIPFNQLIHEFEGWVHVSWAPVPKREILTINSSGVHMGVLV
jgi:zinc D-Ala-D-Ala carboxypeptidase